MTAINSRRGANSQRRALATFVLVSRHDVIDVESQRAPDLLGDVAIACFGESLERAQRFRVDP